MLYDLIEKIEIVVDDYVFENMKECDPKDLGLDSRCGGPVFVNEDGIAVPKGARKYIEYYGGFEYIDNEYVEEVGPYVFYLAEDDRVADHLDTYYSSIEEVE